MKRYALMIFLLLLAACDGGEQRALQAELDGMSANLSGRVPPLPVVKAYQPAAYDAFELPDPFGPEKMALTAKGKSGSGGGLQPDMNRPKEPLEAFTLESLKMVGTLERQKNRYALVQADAGVYRVRAGNYLGQNFGVITKITESEIQIRDLVQDPTGDWAERESSLLLQEVEGTK